MASQAVQQTLQAPSLAPSAFPAQAQQIQSPAQAQPNQPLQSFLSPEEILALNTEKSLLRVTCDKMPSTFNLQKEVAIPLGISAKPYGVAASGEECPTVHLGGKPIVRCKDCRAYVNPFVRFVDNGMKWICNFCGDLNNTESYYYSATSKTGVRTDVEQRPELSKGTVDFIASGEYMSRPPMPPTFVFVLDVSRPAVDSGYI